MRGGITPTDQQQAIVDAGLRGESIIVQALAGTGKTTAMAMVADAITGASGGRARVRATVYNKEAAADGRKKFPPGTECTTIHAMAWDVMLGGHCDQALGIHARMLLAKLGKNFQHLKPWEATRRLDLETLHLTCDGHKTDGAVRICSAKASLTAAAQMRLAQATLRSFCNSADPEVARHHTVVPQGTPECIRDEVRDVVLCAARNLWADMLSPRGRQRFSHDAYLKLFQLWITNGGIQVPYDVMILDEAQDSTPCVQSIFATQQDCQLIIVGDSYQSLYQWRGARDALLRFRSERGLPQLHLTRSWRFGPQIAEQGNLWLEALESPIMIEGDPGQPGIVGAVEPGSRRTVLCRTNAGVVAEAIEAMDRDESVHIVGGGDDAMGLARGIADLQDGKKPSHPQLAIFDDWDQLVAHVDDDLCDDSDLRLAVQLAQRYGARKMIVTLSYCDTPAARAKMILSTMHRAKGREWPNVTIGQDVKDPGFDEYGNMVPVPGDEMMLFYVACTRARRNLDNERLGFVHRLLERVP